MKNAQRITIIIFALFISASQIFAQDTYNLTYKFEKGKTYFYRVTQKMDMVMNAMGQEMTQKSDVMSKLRMEITDVTPAIFEIISSIDSMHVKASGMQGDTESNGEGIVGKKTKLIYNNFGKKIKTIEIDPIVTTDGMTAAGGSALLMRLAEKPVKVGEVLTVNSIDTNKVGESGSMITKSDVEYKVEGKEVKNGVECVKLSYTGKVKTEGSMSMQGMDMVLEGTGKSTGFLFFNMAKGLIQAIDDDTTMDINMAMPAQNMTIPMNQKLKSVTTLLEK